MTQCKFLDPVDLRVLSDGGILAFEVLAPIIFLHPDREVIIESGFRSQATHSPFNKLEEIDYCVRAGLLYDWMLRRESIVRGDADRMFRDALESCGVIPGTVKYLYQQLLVSRYARGDHKGDL